MITTGEHFNIQLLTQAFKLYDRKYDIFGGFARIKIIYVGEKSSITAVFFTACYAQAFWQGIYITLLKRDKI